MRLSGVLWSAILRRLGVWLLWMRLELLQPLLQRLFAVRLWVFTMRVRLFSLRDRGLRNLRQRQLLAGQRGAVGRSQFKLATEE